MTEALWYLSRGTGTVTLILLTAVMAVGIGSRSGRPVFGLPRFAVTTVHRDIALIATALLGVHVTTLLFDPYAQLRLVDLVVPFAGSYRPLWLGLGTLGLDLVVVLIVSSLARHRLGPRVWRTLHWSAYLAWPVALLHGLGTGTDAGQPWLRGVAAACAVTVLAALTWRISDRFGEYAADRLPRIRREVPR